MAATRWLFFVVVWPVAVLLPHLLSAQKDFGFKMAQQGFPNVKKAYIDKENDLKKFILEKGVKSFSNEILVRVFKHEEVIEIWIKPPGEQEFKPLKRYKLCRKSGEFGPKRLLGDRQIPEGFYQIQAFQPEGSHFLALDLDYPNEPDRVRGAQKDVVSLTSSCLPDGNISLGDDAMKELYVLAVEARAGGQQAIPVHIFPAQLNEKNYAKLLNLYPGDQALAAFWLDLKTGYDYFERTKLLPQVGQVAQGGYQLQDTKGNVLQSSTTLPTSLPAPQATAKPATTAPRETQPARSQPNTPVATNPTPATSTMEGIHEVRAGQTLFGIAKQYGMELETLRRLNNLRSNNILVGQQLRVMKPSSVATKTATPTPASVAQAQPAATSQEKFYTAQAGDTLYGIARRNGITVATLLEMNNKKQATLLVGEKLRVRW